MKIITNVPPPWSCPCTTSSHRHGNQVCGKGVFSEDGDPCQECAAEERVAADRHAQTNSSDFGPAPTDAPNLKDHVSS
jgi:hypothetical protein